LYKFGKCGCNTTGLDAGGPLYAGGTGLGVGIHDGPGGMTNTRPRHPAVILIVGTVEEVGVSGGVLIDPARFRRRDASQAFSLNSSGISAGGPYWEAGFYDWAATAVTLDEGNLTQTYGVDGKTYAAHPAVVPAEPGIVTGGGQVGLRVTGTQDRETGNQLPEQTKSITDDITTLTANWQAEAAEKFSGEITFELYVVSGSPSAYSLTCNYGYSKYTDAGNDDFTITGITCQWRAGANDSDMDLQLWFHRAEGWTYAATGFEPGNGMIASRLTDQQLESDIVDIVSGANGAWKRTDLNQFVAGGESQGFLLGVVQGSPNSLQNLSINIAAVSEELA